MKKFAIISLSILALVGAPVIVGVFQASSRRTKAATIKVGDTKAQVERRLGEATMVTPFSTLWHTNALQALFCDTAETWGYGSRFHLRSQYPWFEFSMFLPHPRNIAIEFDSSGRVVRVLIPKLK